MKYALFLLAPGLLVAGCGQIEAPPETISAQSVSFIPFTIPDEANPARMILAGADADWRAAYDADQQKVMRDLAAFSSRHERDWQTADVLAEQIVARWEGTLHEHFIAQNISHRMLTRLVHNTDPSAERLEAVERHVARLLQWEHPHLPVLLDGIEHVGSRWSDAQRAEAISAAKASADRWLANNPCEACLGDGIAADASAGARDRVIAEMQAALPEADRRIEILSAAP